MMGIDFLLLGVSFLLGSIVGGTLVWLVASWRLENKSHESDYPAERAVMAERIEERQVRLVQLEQESKQIRSELDQARTQVATAQALLQAERKSAQEKQLLLDQAHTSLSNAFQALSAEALQRNNAAFLDLAKETLSRFQEGAQSDLEQRSRAIGELVKPVREQLGKLDESLRTLEATREGAYRGLHQQASMMLDMYQSLKSETANLTKALRTPTVRGRWGEIQLRRVVELAGMLEHCDFDQQVTVSDGEGGKLRPDLIVRLPDAKRVVVDAKAPLASYLNAIEVSEEGVRRAYLVDHARQIKTHIKALSTQGYWEQFADAPDFAVLFLPGEHFFSAALEHDPQLIEFGIERRVLLATPTTLIALLRSVAYGWRQEKLSANARSIAALGSELHKRLCDMTGHMGKLGGHLDTAVGAYNQTIATLEGRVLVTARRLKELDASAGDDEIKILPHLERQTRPVRGPESLAKSS